VRGTLATSRSISSMKSLVRPYGFVQDSGKSSVIGTVAGLPYTHADDEKTSDLHPACAPRVFSQRSTREGPAGWKGRHRTHCLDKVDRANKVVLVVSHWELH
jgi:hypothetical protein